MKLISFELEGTDKCGILVDDKVYPFFLLDPLLPANMADFLEAGEAAMNKAKNLDHLINQDPAKFPSYPYSILSLLAPVPHPSSCRDGYAFRDHVEGCGAGANRLRIE